VADLRQGGEQDLESRPAYRSISPGPPENEQELAALVTRITRGDEDALAALYDRTSRFVYGIALKIVGEAAAAEDVAMEVYLQAWRTAGSYDAERGRVLPWLITMARSRSLDSLRSRKARRAQLEKDVDDVLDLSDSRPNPESAIIEHGRSRIVREAMAQLAPGHREAIELAYFSGLTHAEAAEKTGLPLGTVKTRIRSGMIHLRELLEPFAEAL
jgi:RNA polymerase sigma-70 factor (ECF subfamily)